MKKNIKQKPLKISSDKEDIKNFEVYIDPHTFNIIFKEKVSMDDENVNGMFSTDSLDIHINKTINNENILKVVVLHEIIHAILFTSGLDGYLDDVNRIELFTQSLSHKLFSLLKNNKEFINYIMEDNKEN